MFCEESLGKILKMQKMSSFSRTGRSTNSIDCNESWSWAEHAGYVRWWMKWPAMFIKFWPFGNDVISFASRPLIFVYLYTRTQSIKKLMVEYGIKSEYSEEYSFVGNKVGRENPVSCKKPRCCEGNDVRKQVNWGVTFLRIFEAIPGTLR